MPNGTYYYVVLAGNNGGRSVYSNEASAVLSIAAPTNLTAFLVANGAKLTWQSVSGADYYQVLRSATSGGPYNYIGGLSSSTTTFTDQNNGYGLPNGTYYYVVLAGNNGGLSSYSNEASISIGPVTVPNAPTGLSATAGNGSISLTWTAPAGTISSYNVKRSTTSGGPYTAISSSGAVTAPSYIDSTAGSTTSYYVVSAVGPGGESADSGQASATLASSSPTVVTSATASPSPVAGTTASLSVLGADANGESSLTYTWATTGTPPAAVTFSSNATNAAKNTSVTFTQAGTYGFQVTLTDANGLTATSSVSVTVNQTISSVAVNPNPVTVRAGGTQPFFAATEDQFGNHMPASTAFLWFVINGGGSINNGSGVYTAGPNAGTATVRASVGGIVGTATITVTVSPPSTPTHLTATSDSGKVRLAWGASSGATSYNVKRSLTSGGPYSIVANPTGTSFIDSNVTAGTVYYYVVSAVSSGYKSVDSNEASVSATLAPTAPGTLSALGGLRAASLTWSGSTGGAVYNVKRSASSGGPYVTIAQGFAGTSYTDSGLINGTPYYYVVTSTNAQGESSPSNEAVGVPTRGYIIRTVSSNGIPILARQIDDLGEIFGAMPSGAGVTWLNGVGVQYSTGGISSEDGGVLAVYDSGTSTGQVNFSGTRGRQKVYLIHPSNQTYATAINSKGQVVVSPMLTYFQLSDPGHACLWSPDGNPQDLGTLVGTDSNYAYSAAFGINSSGVVVGNSVRDGDGRNYDQDAVLWDANGGIHDLGTLTSNGLHTSGPAYDDGDGEVGRYDTSSASAVNDAGQVVGVSDDVGFEHAFMWHNGMTDLGVVTGYDYSSASAINNNGQVVGRCWSFDNIPDHAFLWDSTKGMVDLNSILPAGSGWVLQGATGINDKGEIIGYGTLNGKTQSYLLNFPAGPHPLWQGNAPMSAPCNCTGAKGTFGPQHNDPVNLATGAEEYVPDPDITVYNPNGPEAAFQRSFRSDQAANGASSPGLSPGWSHNYDYLVQHTGASGTWGAVTLDYPNGSQESWTPVLDGAGKPTGSLTPPPGSPYLVNGSPGAAGTWNSLTLTWKNGSQWQFTPSVEGYRLTQIASATGQSIDLNWDDNLRLSAITDTTSGTSLLSLNYDNKGNLASIEDAYGRQVTFTFGPAAGPGLSNVTALLSVSQLVAANTQSPPVRWSYAYVGYGNEPLLSAITVPSPTGHGSSTSLINYAGDEVASLVDANHNQSVYTYGSSSTQIQTLDASGNVESASTGSFTQNSYSAGSTDVQNHSTKSAYADAVNVSLPTEVVDKNNNTASVQYDPYGNITQTVIPRGVETQYIYDYSSFALGRLSSVQEGVNLPSPKMPTTFSYFEPSGLLKSITAPAPGTIGSGRAVTTSFTYDPLGNLLTVTEPGNDAASTLTTAYNYTSDGTYSQAAALGQPLTVSDGLGHLTHLRYDGRGNPVSALDALGNEVDTTYTLADAPLTTTLPATGQTGPGHSTSVNKYLYQVGTDSAQQYGPLVSTSIYDESGNPGATPPAAAKLVRQVVYGYGLEDELLSRTGSAEPVAYAYDPLYRLITLTDGGRHVTHYTYDQVGNLAQVTYPGGDSQQFPAYDAEGNLLRHIDGRGIETDYAYNDPENLLTDVQYPATPGLNVHTAYDAYGRPAATADGTGSQVYGTAALPGYDDADDPLNVETIYTGLPPQLLTYSYYPDGSRKTLGTPAGSFMYHYDAAGRLSSLTNPFGQTSAWAYEDNDWLKRQRLGNGTATEYSHNALGQVVDLANMAGGTVLSDFGQIGYDAAGNRTTVAATVPGAPPAYSGVTTYGYDLKDQLLQEQSSRTGGYSNVFAYDNGASPGAGNPTTFRGQGPNTFNADNQTTAAGFTYDGNGNPVSYKGVSLTFDPEDHLTGVGNTLTASYTASGLRAFKQSAAGTTYFLYDGDQPVLEMDGSGSVTAVNTWGTSGLLSRYAASSSLSTFYTFDPQGNVAQRLDSGGNVLDTFAFDAYGARVGTDNPLDPYSGFEGQFGYYTDAETGLQLLTHRYYDSSTGQFINRDPTGYDGGINIYSYTANNPVNEVDPDGLRRFYIYNPTHYRSPSTASGGKFIGSKSVYVPGYDHRLYIIDVPNGQSVDRNVAYAMRMKALIDNAGVNIADQYSYKGDYLTHFCANNTVGDYGKNTTRYPNPTNDNYLFWQRRLGANFNFGAMGAALGFSMEDLLLQGHRLSMKHGAGLHAQIEQDAIEDGWLYYHNHH